METLYFMGKLLSFLCTISDMPYSCSITCLFSIPRSYTCKIGCQSSFLSTRNRHEFLWLLYEIPRRRRLAFVLLFVSWFVLHRQIFPLWYPMSPHSVFPFSIIGLVTFLCLKDDLHFLQSPTHVPAKGWLLFGYNIIANQRGRALFF